jgi:hypothetical protein
MPKNDASLPGALRSDPKLRELRPDFREKIGYVLAELEDQGFQPKISGAHRSAARQLEKFKQGYSKTAKPGRHNWGLAADIIDRRWGWPQRNDPQEKWDLTAEFFMALRDACDKHGVASGGWWFGRRHWNGKKATAQNPTHRSRWNRYGIGWDVAHCQALKAPWGMRKEYGKDQWG